LRLVSPGADQPAWPALSAGWRLLPVGPISVEPGSASTESRFDLTRQPLSLAETAAEPSAGREGECWLRRWGIFPAGVGPIRAEFMAGRLLPNPAPNRGTMDVRFLRGKYRRWPLATAGRTGRRWEIVRDRICRSHSRRASRLADDVLLDDAITIISRQVGLPWMGQRLHGQRLHGQATGRWSRGASPAQPDTA